MTAWAAEVDICIHQLIADIQTELVRHGYLPQGSNDGAMGPTTKNAIVEYQRTQGMRADGIASPALLEQLRGN